MNTMRLLALGVLLAMSTPAVAHAQGNSQQMRDMVAQMRATAAQMKGQLPPEDIAEMLRSADEIEKGIKDGAYAAPAPAAPDLTARIAAAHQGKLDWLMGEPACVGYMWENWRTFRLQSGDRDAQRDLLCRKAFSSYEDYFLTTRNGGDRAHAMRALAAYDKAAQEAVDFFERK